MEGEDLGDGILGPFPFYGEGLVADVEQGGLVIHGDHAGELKDVFIAGA